MRKFVLKSGELPEEVREEFKIYSELLGQLLFSRGIKTREEAEKFLNPNYNRDIHDPFLMRDMEEAVERVLFAVENGEKILIFSDYDADGIPGAVVLNDFFKKIGYPNFEHYIPHRQNEGYGLNPNAVKKFAENNVDLIITIDCGIVSFDEVDLANDLGVDVIITDHHTVAEKLPEAFAVVNPKRHDCNYPDKNLAGAGVVFKLVQALLKKGNFGITEGWEKWLIDMVGLATISDMVPLKGENRALSFFGLMVLRKSPRNGLVHLLRKTKVEQRLLTEDDIAFMITPRINAASRLGEQTKALDLLLAQKVEDAVVLAEYLDNINTKRKTLVTGLVKEANKKLKERDIGAVIVIGSPKWNSGVSGLVASSLVEKYQKTCFVWGQGESEKIKGSCRSCGKIDVVELMRAVEDETFLNVGGHKMAGGFSVSVEKIHLLEEKLLASFDKVSKMEAVAFEVDKKISLEEVNWENYKDIEKLAPFGEGNPKPTFLLENIEIFNVRVFGKQNNHLGLDFMNKKGQKISAIRFFAPEIQDGKVDFKRGDKISLIVNFEKSTFMNTNELRLRIVDFV